MGGCSSTCGKGAGHRSLAPEKRLVDGNLDVVAPRIKYQLHRSGDFNLSETTEQLKQLAKFMRWLEELGATPILYDGKVAGNCGLLQSYVENADVRAVRDTRGLSESVQPAVVLVSRSGKPPGHTMGKDDFVRIDHFDYKHWKVMGWM